MWQSELADEDVQQKQQKTYWQIQSSDVFMTSAENNESVNITLL